MKRVSKKTLVLVGAIPPPHHGQTLFTEALLGSTIHEAFTVYHLDTSDKRSLDNIGAFDIGNLLLGLRATVGLIQYCLRRPDIVYVPLSQNVWGFLRDGLLILTASALSNAAIVIHFHGGESFNQFRRSTNLLMKWFIAFVLRRTDLAIVLGKRLRHIFAADARRVEVVPNGIDSFLSIQHMRDDQRDGATVCYLGGLFRAKGVVDLVRAAAIVFKTHPHVRLKFAGEWWGQEPDTKHEALEIVATSGIARNVEFIGKVTGLTKEQFLLDADILVLPSWSEGFPLVILEAMSAGVPVIATDVGAIPEVVVDNVTGILVEKQNPQQLASAILRLVENPDLRRRMGEEGRKRYREFYTFQHCANRLIEVLHSAVAHDNADQAPTFKESLRVESTEREVA
jgi:glycosyltransferase involved in cell wall biosynthesis